MIRQDLLEDKKRLRTVSGGQRIAPEKEGGRELYIIKQGNVDSYAITTDKKLEKRSMLGPGQIFDEKEFFGGDMQSVFVANGEVTLYVVPEGAFDKIAAENPRLMYELLREAYGIRPPAPQPPATQITQQTAAAQGTPAPAEAPSPQPAQTVEKAAQPQPAPIDLSATAGLLPQGHKGYPGITGEEYTKYLYEKEYTCPNCGQTFKSYKVFLSKLVPSAPTRYDFRKFFTGFKLEWYDLLTCPHCYFSMFADFFTEPKYLIKKKIEQQLAAARDAIMLDFDADRNVDFVFICHYLALICARGYANEKQLQMRLWANLSWLYEDVGDEEMMRYAAKKSAETSEAIYMESKLSPAQEQVICLSTGGMLYRAGAREGVLKWLFSAKTNKKGKKAYVDLAEDLMEEIRGSMQGE